MCNELGLDCSRSGVWASGIECLRWRRMAFSLAIMLCYGESPGDASAHDNAILDENSRADGEVDRRVARQPTARTCTHLHTPNSRNTPAGSSDASSRKRSHILANLIPSSTQLHRDNCHARTPDPWPPSSAASAVPAYRSVRTGSERCLPRERRPR